MDKTKLKAKAEKLIAASNVGLDVHVDLSAFVEALIECAGALEVSRGQWIHSVNKEKCLSTLSRLEELTK